MNINTTKKKCRRCGCSKPLIYFEGKYYNDDGSVKEYLRVCKKCKHKEEKERYQRNHEADPLSSEWLRRPLV